MRFIVKYAFLPVVLLTIGCGGGTGTGGTFGSSETLSFEAWDVYRAGGNDARSEELFLNALSLDPSFSEAHNGLGWLNFRKAGQSSGEIQASLLASARTSFQRATTFDPENIDAWVGLAGLELAVGNWEAAVSAGNAAWDLERSDESNTYFSSHDNIDFRDVHLILAEAYFFLGQFTNTKEADPNNTLHHLDILSRGFKTFYNQNDLKPVELILKIEELQSSLN